MVKKPIRLLFLGEFGSHTGFGTAGINLVDRFYEMGRDEGMPAYDISVQALAFRRHPYDETQFPRPYKIYPMVGDQGRFPHGQDQMNQIIQMAKPQVVICFGDKWMIEHVNDPQFVPEDVRKTFFAIAYWAIDGDPIPPNWFDHFHKFDHVIFYSKFGYAQALQRDSRMQYQCSMVYHGVNPYLFRKLPSPYVGTLKERHGFKDKFVIGAVMRNQARKSHPRLLQAFQKFSQNKNDVVLLLNCLAVDQGWDLNDLISRFGLTGKVFFTHTTQNPAVGMPIEHLVGLYNMMDVHTPVAEGEGFGLPILESMSCGVPNLVNHYGAEKELVEDSGSGMTIKADTVYMRGSDHNFMRPLISIDDLTEKLQWMYDHPEERKEMGRKGRAYAFTMNWDRFAHQFDQVIKRVVEGSQVPLQGELI